MKILSKNRLIPALLSCITVGFYIFQYYALATAIPDPVGIGLFIIVYCFSINIFLTQLTTATWLYKDQGFSYIQIVGAAFSMLLMYGITFFVQTAFNINNLFWFVAVLIVLNCPFDLLLTYLFFRKKITATTAILICTGTIVAFTLPLLFLQLTKI